ncbi:PREDICTED: uncharacterized protein LOC108769183 [Trachymyrmex cornetzi]|uniref:uncharacterized protein LOC108769183 n=1 Tax=Trachymyrmex cornetzi TaxID=471704 RepID=UPI00084F153D|nr:PREDICTED: uncharacterized protein LOC108769183 [Trachymyrmex cornetzi]
MATPNELQTRNFDSLLVIPSAARNNMFSLEERFEILKTYFQSQCCVAETVRILKRNMGRDRAPTEGAIRKLVRKVREKGMLVDDRSGPRARTVRTPENIEAVAQSVRQNPTTSTRRRSQQLSISRTSLRRILHKDLGLFAYKIQMTQELKANDHPLRYQFAVWAIDQLNNDVDFGRKIIFSDEAHFHLGGYVNKQNCRIWGSEQPHTIVERPMHPPRVTVWCGFWSGGIIGPFFFENDAGNAVTVNGERYRAMLTNFLWPQIDTMNVDDLWFQQDGATCHTSRLTIDLLRTKFNNRIISRSGDVNWPARSCDLTPLDFFLWGAVKDRCYADNPETIPALKNNITTVLSEIGAEVVQNVINNWGDRMAYCKASRGSHMNEIVFHS